MSGSLQRSLTSGLRRLLHAWGIEVVYSADDPVLATLLTTRETLRVQRNLPAWKVDHLLAQIPAEAHLRHLLRGFNINLAIDVGANAGQFALTLRRLGYKGRIVSFEPQSALHATLRAAAAGDPAWQVHPFALGAATAELTLHTYRDHTLSSLHPVNASGQARFPEYFRPDHTERVPVRRLDDLASELHLEDPQARILLKTDTQGHDLAVFEGAPVTLARAMVVMSEGSVRPMYQGTPSYQDLVRFLGNAGYNLSGIFPLAHSDVDFSLIEVDCHFVRSLPSPGPACAPSREM